MDTIMRPLTIRSTIIDPEDEITYEILAYRALSRELVLAVRNYHQQMGKKRLKKRSKVTILSTIGLGDSNIV